MPFIYEQDRRQRQQLRPDPVEYQAPASFGETYVAAFKYAVDEELSISGALNREGFRQRQRAFRDLVDNNEIKTQDYVNRRGRIDYDRLSQEFETIKSTEQLAEERREYLRKQREENQEVIERGSGVAQFLGMASAFVIDPINLATLPVSTAATAARGLSWVGRGLLTARREAALSTAAELAIQPLVYQHKSDIESPYSWQDAVANIGLAAAGSAGLGFVAGGVAGYFRAVRERAAPFVDPKDTELAMRSMRELEQYLDETRPNTVNRVIDEEYGKYLNNEYASLEELRVQTRQRLETELETVRAEQMPLLQMIAEQGGLNRRAWQESGLDVDAIAKRADVKEKLPKRKPLFKRKDAGLTPDQFAQRLSEAGYFADGTATPGRALEVLQTALRNPDTPANPQAATRLTEIENTIARVDAEDSKGLEALYKEAQRMEIDGDLQRLRELEINREQMNAPSRTRDKYEMPQPERVAPQTITERQRAIMEEIGMAEDYDRAIEAYNRLETKRVWSEEEGRLVDADEIMEELDDEIEGLNEVLRCSING